MFVNPERSRFPFSYAALEGHHHWRLVAWMDLQLKAAVETRKILAEGGFFLLRTVSVGPVRSQTLRIRVATRPDSIGRRSSGLPPTVTSKPPQTQSCVATLQPDLPAFAASVTMDSYLTRPPPWMRWPTNSHVLSSRRLQERHPNPP